MPGQKQRARSYRDTLAPCLRTPPAWPQTHVHPTCPWAKGLRQLTCPRKVWPHGAETRLPAEGMGRRSQWLMFPSHVSCVPCCCIFTGAFQNLTQDGKGIYLQKPEVSLCPWGGRTPS